MPSRDQAWGERSKGYNIPHGGQIIGSSLLGDDSEGVIIISSSSKSSSSSAIASSCFTITKSSSSLDSSAWLAERVRSSGFRAEILVTKCLDEDGHGKVDDTRVQEGHEERILDRLGQEQEQGWEH